MLRDERKIESATSNLIAFIDGLPSATTRNYKLASWPALLKEEIENWRVSSIEGLVKLSFKFN